MNTDILYYAANFCYNNACSSDFKIDVHLHDLCEVFMAVSGNIRYFVEGQLVDLAPGDIIITNTEEFHRPITLDRGLYHRRYIQFHLNDYVSFSQGGYDPLSVFTRRLPGNDNLISHRNPQHGRIMEIFDQIEQLALLGSEKGQFKIKVLMLELFIIFDEVLGQKNSYSAPPKIQDSRIHQVLSHINKHYTEPISLEELSATYFIDKYYLCHLFKQATGFTIKEYIGIKRIQLAKQLISNGHPIEEASNLCGYNDYSNFYKTFRKVTKLSPSEYLS